jgi:ATP-dependent helicase HrpB
VTEGILTRMLQHDPELSGYGCVIFDEYHERSLQADLGLALCLEVRAALRPDLRIVVMSATLDAAAVADLLAPCAIIECPGQPHEVETRYLRLSRAHP